MKVRKSQKQFMVSTILPIKKCTKIFFYYIKKRLYNLLKTENSTCLFNTKPVYLFDQMAIKHTDPY